MKKLACIPIALLLVPAASAGLPTRHGFGTMRASLCNRITQMHVALPIAHNQTLASLSAYLNGRQLHYWNESPNVSYFYGVASFVEVSAPRRTLWIRAVRVVPVCARLRISYSW